ncbi:tripartite tricarboxylate transporter permease [Kerstersia sp.]|uniref:tripartite tricarboxylate transporter permease n=1 Tax=Kerstersia sp. TaxID=1930783 RepID=UPI003F90187E
MDMALNGLLDALDPSVILFVFLGILLGYAVGVLPGLNRPAALAVAVPLSYYMSPLAAVAFLIGIAKASGAGGATTAILLNTPGEPSSAPTCLDGYPLTKAGKGEKALKVALYGSVIGDLVGTLLLIAIALPLARFALRVGPVEMTAIMFLALTFIAALAGTSAIRGLIAGLFGILLACVGMDAETAMPRMTFDHVELMDGIPLLAVTVGMLAMTEMFIQAERLLLHGEERSEFTEQPSKRDRGLSWPEFRRVLPTIVQSSGVGIVVGIIPGLGPTVASFLAYGLAKRTAKPGDCFGKGEIKGVAAAETADNVVTPASLIPLFALGIPGSVSAAVLIAAFMIHGVVPGPRMFEEHGQLIYGIYGAMLVASLLMLLVGRLGLVGFAQLTRVPVRIIIPIVIMLCMLGSYLETRSMFSVQLMFGCGVLGYLMHRFDFSRITFLIGFVVGPLFELSLRQSLIITNGNPQALLQHPVALGIVVISLAALVSFLRKPS